MPLSQADQDVLHRWLRSRFGPRQPGIAALVVQAGAVQLRRAYGLANVELNVPLRPDHAFRIGSISKQFTAVAVLLLMEEGKLDLGDPITRYLPEFPTHRRRITLEHLLTHTSGVRNYTDIPEYPAVSRTDVTLAERIAFFKNQPLDFVPGTKWSYSNSGYVLLAAVIEKVSGLEFTDYVQQRLLGPLGLRDTQNDVSRAIVPRQVAGYCLGAGGLERAPFESMTQAQGDGGLSSTVDDLARWNAALCAGQVLKPATLERAWTPVRLADGSSAPYGYGWGTSVRVDGTRVVEHSGGMPGFWCHALYAPEHDLYVAVLANTNNPALDPSLVAWRLALHALGTPYQEPPPYKPAQAALKLEGTYRLGDRLTLLISRRGPKMQLRFQEQMAPLDLIPTAADHFEVRDSFSRLEIQREGKQVSALRLFDQGQLVGDALPVISGQDKS